MSTCIRTQSRTTKYLRRDRNGLIGRQPSCRIIPKVYQDMATQVHYFNLYRPKHNCHCHEPRLTQIIIHNLQMVLDYDDSDSDSDTRRSKSVLQEATSKSKTKPKKKTEKKREDATSPPLPGFGNPEFEQMNPQSGTLPQNIWSNQHVSL